METIELIYCLSRGEDSRHQFKVDFNNADALVIAALVFLPRFQGTIEC